MMRCWGVGLGRGWSCRGMSGSVGVVFWAFFGESNFVVWVGLVLFGLVRCYLVRFWVGVEWKGVGYGIWNV